jgi:hypothetical protein
LDSVFNPVNAVADASTSQNFNLGADNGDGVGNIDGTAPDGAVMLGSNDSDLESGFINTLFHPQYQGVSTYDIDVQVDQILDFGSVGGVEGGFSPVTALGYVRVTYEYEPVPEPGTLALASLGIVGLISARTLRRRAR